MIRNYTRGELTQSTIEMAGRASGLIGSDERLATLPALDKLSMTGGKQVVCLLHGTKVVELTPAEARKHLDALLALTTETSDAVYEIESGDTRIVFSRAGTQPVRYEMEWEGSHGPFNQTDYETSIRGLIVGLNAPAIRHQRQINPWRAVGPGRHHRRTESLIG